MDDPRGTEVVIYERRGPIAWITLNRPEAMNSIDTEMRELLPKVVRQADADPEVRVMVVHGAGDRAFCAGGNLKETRTADSIVALRRSRRANRGWMTAFGEAEKPILAAIHGYCVGGGLEIALASDLRVASEDAQFGMPDVRWGFIGGGGGTQRLPRLVGLGHALHMILTGELIGAQEAYRIGLVTRVFPREQLLAEAERLADLIASRGPLAVPIAKEVVHKGFDMKLADGLRLEGDLAVLLQTTEDRKEGVAAFREKRKPVFKGR